MKPWKLLVLLWSVLSLTGCFNAPPEGMVLIPGGTFFQGTNSIDTEGHALEIGLEKPWYADESPQQKIILPDFYIDRFEVTNQEYYLFSQMTDRKPPSHWKGLKFSEGKEHYPVTNVTFFDAAAYAEWAGKRLPTEKEWEKAARGPDRYLYPWGNEFDFGAANISRSNKKKRGLGLKPVGSFPLGASIYGVQDMIGNAWEWVWDYYLPYPGSKYKTPDFGKKFVVVRGLSYLGIGHFRGKDYKKAVALKARASYREKLIPFDRKIDVGFRCARDKDPWTKRIYEFFTK